MGWSPYPPNQKRISEYIARQGHDFEKWILDSFLCDLSPKKITHSFVDDDMNLIGTPDFCYFENGHLLYGEIKSVLKRKPESIDLFLSMWDSDGTMRVEEIMNMRKKINLFSHLVQCLLNMFLISKMKEFSSFDDFLLVYYVSNRKMIRAQKLVITDPDMFVGWAQDVLMEKDLFYLVPSFLKTVSVNISKHNKQA